MRLLPYNSVLIVGAISLLLPSRIEACEPVIPFITVIGGPAMLLKSLVALPLAVLFKSLLFARFERQLKFGKALLLMLFGNVLTTLVGIVVAFSIGGVPAAPLFFLPIAWYLCCLPCKRASATSQIRWVRCSHPALLGTLMVFVLYVSCILFAAAQGTRDLHIGTYWLLKICALYLALFISIMLTSFWEEWCVWKFAEAPADQHFFPAVIRANLWTLLLIMAGGAALVLPHRFASPGFLDVVASLLKHYF